MGFNTSGIPKITVSLILNNPGTSDKKAIALLSSRFEKIYIAITSPRVAPAPLNSPHICKKYILITFLGV